MCALAFGALWDLPAARARKACVGQYLLHASSTPRGSHRATPSPCPSAPLKWKPAGAWPKTQAYRFTFTVPPGGPSVVTIDLDAARIGATWATSDAANFGVLVKLVGWAGPSVAVASGGADNAGTRPALTLNYTTG